MLPARGRECASPLVGTGAAMHSFARPPHLDRSMLRRAAFAVVAVTLAALVAAGCGSDGGGGSAGGESGIVGEEGPLAWLPQETWLVASGRLDPAQIDTAIETLDRLPAWTLVESFLPAGDGKGLRRELLQELATGVTGGEAKRKVTAKQLEAAFGERVGMAIFGTDFEAFDGDEPPLVAWVEVDDRDAAEQVARDLATGAVQEQEHEGVEYLVSERDEAAIVVGDELLLFAPSEARLKVVIEAHEGDESLADDETARAVIEGGIGEAMVGAAVQTDPLLDEDVVRTAAASFYAERRDGSDEGEPNDADRKQAQAFADRLVPVLRSTAVDGLVPDWVAGSVTVDGTGLRVRGAWSNPRDLAEPEVGSRELVERMPADAPVASATVSDGSGVERIQDAWSEVQDEYDFDLRELAAECGPADRWACNLGAEAALAVLEDEGLAETVRETGDTSTAFVQDLSGTIASVVGAADGGAAKLPTERVLEVAIASEEWPRWTPPSELSTAARDAGLLVTANEDQTRVTVRVRPGSPLATALQTRFAGEARTALIAWGIAPEQLLTTGGITFTAQEVDGIRVSGLPDQAPSRVVAALEGEADTLGDAETYREVVDAVEPPKDVGVYGYVDLRAYVESLFGALAAEQPEMNRVLPTIRNNLADAPGVLAWTTREEVDGEQVGVGEYVLPILE